MLLKAGACVPVSCLKLSFNCTCGPCKCGVTNDHATEDEKENLTAAPEQLDMARVAIADLALMPSASKASVSCFDIRQSSKIGQPEVDELSTESGSSASSRAETTDSSPVGQEWFTPSATPAQSRRASFDAPAAGPDCIEEAIAVALSPVDSPKARSLQPTAELRYRQSSCDDLQRTQYRFNPQDWWDDADTKVVAGLEVAPSLTRLIGVDIVKHKRSTASKRPWHVGESHTCYRRLGVQDSGSSYVAWWLNTGDASSIAVCEVIDRPALERCLANDPLGKRLKFIIRAVKCALPFPGKGPKEADTVGAFFGKGASLNRTRTTEGADLVVIQIDLYYLFFLRLALQNVGFRQGNVVDLILVDWPGQAVLASCRLSVTEEYLKLVR